MPYRLCGRAEWSCEGQAWRAGSFRRGESLASREHVCCSWHVRAREFSSPLEAQLWIERRLHRWAGWSAVVTLTAAVLLFNLLITVFAVFFIARTSAGRSPPEALQSVLAWLGQVTILALYYSLALIGIITGLNFGTFRSSVQSHQANAHLMPSYFAALPFTTGNFAWTKMRAAVQRMLWPSAGVLLMCAIVAQVSGFTDAWMARHAQWRIEYGLTVTLALGALPYVSLVMWVLSATASVMWISFAGRRAVWGCVFAGITIMLGNLLWSPRAVMSLLAVALPVAAALKLMGLAALILYVGSRGLLSWSRLAVITSFWAATVGTLVACFTWYAPEGQIGMLAIVLAPVLGAVAAPVALTLNRVR